MYSTKLKTTPRWAIFGVLLFLLQNFSFAQVSPAINPDLSSDQTCDDFNVVLVVDESGSIDEGDQGAANEQAVKDAIISLANGLNNSGANLALIEFDSNALQPSIGGATGYQMVDDDYIDDLQNYVDNGYNPDGCTNWEDAFEEVVSVNNSAIADLVVFITDGEPTVNNDNTCGLCNNFCFDGLQDAIIQANIVKGQGSHIFVLGVGEAQNNAAEIQQISGPDQDLQAGANLPSDPGFAQADYTLAPFSELQQCLENIANQSCSDVPNPDLILPDCTELNVILILDESGSIDGEARQDVIDGAVSLATGFANSGADLAIVEFADVAEITSFGAYGAGYNEVDGGYAAALEDYLDDNYNPEGWTNWEDAFLKAADLNDITVADLIVFMTDGNPTAYVNGGNCFGCGDSDSEACYDCAENVSLSRAKAASELLKLDGSHLFGLAVGDEINLANISAVTGLDQDLGPGDIDGPGPDPDFAQADYTSIPFSELEECFALIASITCCDLEIQCPMDSYYTCLEDVPTGDPADVEILDSCGEVSIDIQDLYSDNTGCIGDILLLTRLYFVSDDVHSKTCEVEIYIEADSALTFIGVPGDIEVTCDMIPEIPEVTAQGGCEDVIINFEETTSSIGDCAIDHHTQTQGGWGTVANGMNPGVYRDANFASAFPNGLEIGCTYTLTLSTSSDVEGFLPSGTTPSALTENIVNPGNSYDNVFAGQLTALALNIGFDNYDPTFSASDTPLQDLLIADGTFSGWSVIELFEEAEKAFGGCDSQYSLSELNDAAAMINENFVDGSTDNGNLVCGGSECSYTITRTWSATTECDDVSETQIITVVNDIPVITCPIDTELGCGESTDPMDTGYATAEVGCGEVEITYEDSETFDCGVSGMIIRTWTATNECGESTSCEQTLTIQGGDLSIDCPGNVTIECNESIDPSNTGMAEGSDNCGSVFITYEDSVDPGCGMSKTITRTWTATNVCMDEVSCEQIITVVDNIPPVLDTPDAYYSLEWGQIDFNIIDAFLNGDITAEEVAALGPEYLPTLYELGFFFPTATDECDGDVDVDLSQVLIGSEDLECPSVAIAIWQFSATDACGNQSEVFEVVCEFFDTTDPELSGLPENVELVCPNWDLPPVADVTATDSCDTELDETYEETTDDSGCPIYVYRTWTATDDCGNTASYTQTITLIDDVPPVFDPFEPLMTFECDEVIDIEMTGSDDCGTVIITYEDLPFSGGCFGSIERLWTITDLCGNSTTASQVLLTVDTTPPVFDGIGDDMDVDCSETIIVPTVTVSDNCSNSVEYTFEEMFTPGTCPQNYMITWTWTAEDDCGNVAVETKTVTVSDMTPPSFVDPPGELLLTCDMEIPEADEVIPVTDNCSDWIMNFNSDVVPGDCPQEWTIVRTWTAIDQCDNENEHIQSIYIVDDTAPSFTSFPEDVMIECPEELTFESPEAEDLCGSTTITFEDETLLTDCPSEYTILRTYTATDQCSNSTFDVQMLSVFDDTAPELSDYPENINITCEDPLPEAPVLTANDGCDGEVEVEFSENFIGDVPDPEADEHCILEQPATTYYDTDWALYLVNQPDQYAYYTLLDGSYKAYADGSAHIVATVVSTENANAGWEIDVWLENGLNWEDWSSQSWSPSYKDDAGIAGDNYLDWWYYIISGELSNLTGWGDFAGSYLELSHAPSSLVYGYQVGQSANNVNGEFGSGGWFNYEGVLVDSSNDLSMDVFGGGDLAFNHDCCLNYEIVWNWTVTDCAGNMENYSASVYVGEADGSGEGDTGDGFASCPTDFDNDGATTAGDLLILLAELGCEFNNCGCDLNGDGRTNGADMLSFLGAFGTECE